MPRANLRWLLPVLLAAGLIPLSGAPTLATTYSGNWCLYSSYTVSVDNGHGSTACGNVSVYTSHKSLTIIPAAYDHAANGLSALNDWRFSQYYSGAWHVTR